MGLLFLLLIAGLINKLVRMQHYKIPTRLLDVTSHAYVALFFACEGDESQNGKVFVFGFPQNGIAFFDDYERLLTIGLEIRVDFDGLIRDAISGYLGILDFYHWKVFFDTNKSKYKDDYLKLSSDIANRLRDSEKSEPTEAIRTLHEIENLIDFTYIELCKTATENPEDNPDMQQWPSEMQKLQEVLGGFVSSFIDNKCNQFNLPNKYSNLSRLSAFLLWFTRTMICLPRLNNERIRRQQGAFIIQPPFADFNKLSSLFDPSMFRLSIAIDGASKKDILDKLKEDHKITRSYLFPELESSAPDIVEKFIPNYYE